MRCMLRSFQTAGTIFWFPLRGIFRAYLGQFLYLSGTGILGPPFSRQNPFPRSPWRWGKRYGPKYPLRTLKEEDARWTSKASHVDQA